MPRRLMLCTFVLALIGVSGCGGESGFTTVVSNPPPASGATINLTAGGRTDVASGTLVGGNLSGTLTGLGPVVVADPGNNLPGGMTVKIASYPITETSLTDGARIATPLVTVESTASSLPGPITLTVPKPTTGLPVAYWWDGNTRKFHGVSIVGETTDSLTLLLYKTDSTTPTGKCGVFVATTPAAASRANDSADSGFRPGTDDWPFINYGTVAGPGGNCAGMSLSAAYYYSNYKAGGGSIRSNSLFTEGTAYPYDDRDSIHCAERVQAAYGNRRALGIGWFDWNFPPRPQTVINQARDVIARTGKPCLIAMAGGSGGHAIVCHRVSGNTLYVSDPNSPGQEKTISIGSYFFGLFDSFEGSFTNYDNFFVVDFTALNLNTVALAFGDAFNGTGGPASAYRYEDWCQNRYSLVPVDRARIANRDFALIKPTDPATKVIRPASLADSSPSSWSSDRVNTLAFAEAASDGRTMLERIDLTNGAFPEPPTNCNFCSLMERDTSRQPVNKKLTFVIAKGVGGELKWYDAVTWDLTADPYKMPDNP